MSDKSIVSNVLRIPVIEGYTITSVVGAKTDTNVICIDLRAIAQAANQGAPAALISLTAKTVGNATAPGASRTFTINAYWSGEELADSSTAPTVLGDRKLLFLKSLPNSASATRQWELSSPMLVRSPYMYITIDHTTIDASASIALDVMVNRIM